MSELAEVSPPARQDHRVWRFVTGFAAIIASASLATGAYYARENAQEQHRQSQKLELANCVNAQANQVAFYTLYHDLAAGAQQDAGKDLYKSLEPVLSEACKGKLP